jgi:DNA-binding transcriptional regulator YhcF (GntR family)
MGSPWRDNEPIYRQIRDRIVRRLLDEALADEQPLPSVREVAADYRVNPLTVLKAYQLLVDEGLVESRRGLGMFVVAGARKKLVAMLRKQFLEEEWPQVVAKVERLGLDWPALLGSAGLDAKGKRR